MPSGGEGEQRGGVFFLFDTTHTALAAEEAILNGGYWCDMVPRPPGTEDGLCGLAVKVSSGDVAGISGLLKDNGLEFCTYYGDGDNGQ